MHLFYAILFVFSYLTGVYSFSLNTPATVSVSEQFPVNWTWLSSEPTSILIILNDVSKAPDCPQDASKREASFVILDLQNRLGAINFFVNHPGTFQTCAFSYNLTSGDKPVNSLLNKLATSNTFTSSVLMTTVTSTVPDSSGTGKPQVETVSRSSIAGPVIGGVIGGFIALAAMLTFILLRFCHYRVIRLPADSPTTTDPQFQTNPSSHQFANIHPGVAPFPRSAHHSPSPSMSNLTSTPSGHPSQKGRYQRTLGEVTAASSSPPVTPSEAGSSSVAGPSSEPADTPPSYASLSGEPPIPVMKN